MICIQRLLFGIVSSQDIFKRAFDETFNDIPDVYCIADDVLQGQGRNTTWQLTKSSNDVKTQVSG